MWKNRDRKCIKENISGKVNVLKTGLFPGHLFSVPFPPFRAALSIPL